MAAMRTRLAVALVVILVSACGGPTSPSDNIVDQFTGTVQPANSDLKLFDVGNTGEITIKLNTLTPGSNVVVGVLYGQNVSGICQPVQTNSIVTNNSVGHTVLSGSILIKGPYCLVVFDPVGISTNTQWPVAQTYNIEVSHP
jgi:hypothetical protein